MPRISDLERVVQEEGASFLYSTRVGYQSLWVFTIKDKKTMNPIVLSNSVLVAQADFWDAKLEAGRVSDFRQIPGSTVRDLTVAIDADQTANPGKLTLLIPADLVTDDLMLDDIDVRIALCYLNVKTNQEARTHLFAIAYRRGTATDG